uniref:Uncharacterized protein n=1 Tax=Caenorhabditis japonica TaxID=281687 RepID=A0A8R1EK07_CAEJA
MIKIYCASGDIKVEDNFSTFPVQVEKLLTGDSSDSDNFQSNMQLPSAIHPPTPSSKARASQRNDTPLFRSCSVFSATGGLILF